MILQEKDLNNVNDAVLYQVSLRVCKFKKLISIQVRTQVDDQVWIQVWNQIYDQVRGKISNQLHNVINKL